MLAWAGGSSPFVERRSLPFVERKTLRSVFWIKRNSGNEVENATVQRSAVLHEICDAHICVMRQMRSVSIDQPLLSCHQYTVQRSAPTKSDSQGTYAPRPGFDQDVSQ